VERGTGTPLVLVPSLHGRWEYLGPTVDALSASFRVVTFPLCDEPSAGAAFDPGIGLESYAAQVDQALSALGIERAVVCGVSFGGLVALRFAATRPTRTAALVLASTPGPGWHLRPRHEIYVRLPWLFGPVFAVEAPLRLGAELRAAFPRWRDRLRFTRSQLPLLVRRPLSPARMARRARLISTVDTRRLCAQVTAPTLVVTGEPALDHVVPAGRSLEYAAIIRGARQAVLERSGHLGTITRPDAFAEIVRAFVRDISHAAA
jgi:pimeloyl-ACP methyl ester carboxylesterase